MKSRRDDSDGSEVALVNASMNFPTSWIDARKRLATAMRRELSRESAVAEAGRRHVDERLIQCAWYDGLLKGGRLQTASGKALEILDPGRWNTGAGPDFLGATLRLAGEERRGDVEIHVESAEWSRHNHHTDPVYNECLLHAFVWASDDRPYDLLSDGRRLERLEMLSLLEPDMETLRRTLNVEEYPHGRPERLGLCHRQMTGLDEAIVERLLDFAGRERLETKIRRIESQMAGESVEQAFYQALMTAQGHKGSKTLYFLLSKRVRIEELLELTAGESPTERILIMQSVLMHVAGLMDSSLRPSPAGKASGAESGGEREQAEVSGGGVVDPTWEVYHAACSKAWKRAGPYFSDRMIPPTRRWFHGVRPANFPGRRLAAVAHCLARHVPAAGRRGWVESILGHLREAGVCPPLQMKEGRRMAAEIARRVFEVDEPGDYWSTHFTSGGKPLARPQSLIGESSARSLLFNVLLPFGLLRARQENDSALEKGLWALAAVFPPLARNEITSFMEQRLFGQSERAGRLLKGELRHQALFHIFSDCCNHNEKTCSECVLLNLKDGE